MYFNFKLNVIQSVICNTNIIIECVYIITHVHYYIVHNVKFIIIILVYIHNKIITKYNRTHLIFNIYIFFLHIILIL